MDDGRLFQSLPTAIAVAVQQYPRLRETMKEEFGDADELRLRQAMAESNLAAIRAATVQYYGTPAAAEAHGWLGDRFLANGQFGLALSRFRQATDGRPAGGPSHRWEKNFPHRMGGPLLVFCRSDRRTGQAPTAKEHPGNGRCGPRCPDGRCPNSRYR